MSFTEYSLLDGPDGHIARELVKRAHEDSDATAILMNEMDDFSASGGEVADCVLESDDSSTAVYHVPPRYRQSLVPEFIALVRVDYRAKNFRIARIVRWAELYAQPGTLLALATAILAEEIYE